MKTCLIFTSIFFLAAATQSLCATLPRGNRLKLIVAKVFNLIFIFAISRRRSPIIVHLLAAAHNQILTGNVNSYHRRGS